MPTTNLLQKFLNIYPASLKHFLKGHIVISGEARWIGKERVDGSYDIETGEVILWNLEENDEQGLFLVVTHEWGHKIYNERLSSEEKEAWLKARSQEKIDFDLKKSYPAVKLPEEEYCTIFCLLSQVMYWEKTEMRDSSKKLAKTIDEKFPKTAAIVKNHIRTDSRRKKALKKSYRREITHKQVETLKAWIRQAVGTG